MDREKGLAPGRLGERIIIWLEGVVATLLAWTVQGYLLRDLAPARLVGDESEYLAVSLGQRADGLWIRVPLFRAILWPVRVSPLSPRLFMSGLNALVCGAAVTYSGHLAGPLAAAVTAVLLCSSLERALLSCHVWPDTLMGGVLLLLAAILGQAETPVDWALAGSVIALAVLIRIDFTALVLTGTGLILTSPSLEMASLAGLLGPPVTVLLATTLHNGLRWSVWAPDTTLAFNLRVARIELGAPPGTPIATLMRAAAAGRNSLSDTAHHRIGSHRLLPRIGLRLIRRVQTLIGAETFCSQALLTANAPGYRTDSRIRSSRLARLIIRYHFLAVGLALIVSWPILDPTAGLVIVTMAAVFSLVQTRSRYRMALLPVMAVFLPAAWLGGSENAVVPASHWLVGTGLALFMAGLASLPGARAERR